MDLLIRRKYLETQRMCVFLLFVCFLLNGCDNGMEHEQKFIERHKEVYQDKRIKTYQEISRAIENNQGKMDLDKVTEIVGWDQFCLVMTYSSPKEELKDFINDLSSIDTFLPSSYDDSFGLGVLFVKEKDVSDFIYFSRYNSNAVPASSDVGRFIKSISDVLPNGFIATPGLTPKVEKSDEVPRGTCYSREYTMQIHPVRTTWGLKFSIVKKEDNDE